MPGELITGDKRKSIDEAESPPVKIPKMAGSQQKTPITVLQEICQKKVPREMPVYTELQEIPIEYAATNMRFFMRCQALGFESIGGGVTKKMSKHTAAENLLKKCLQSGVEGNEDDVQASQSVETDFISRLLDYCVVKDFEKPTYTCIEDYGPSHSPTFTFKCELNSIQRTGTASNKKQAKQLAAKEVYDIIKLSYPDIEKKIALINDSSQHQEGARQKITSYLELIKQNKTLKTVTSIRHRHRFFMEQDESFVAALRKVLQATDVSDQEKYRGLVKELETMWPCKVSSYLEEEGLDLQVFELLVEYDKFCCVLIGTKEELPKDVLEYFYTMLNIRTAKPEIRKLYLEDICLEPLE